MPICPVCRKELKVEVAAVASAAAPKSLAPFCSSRCKQIDLNKWLSEDYRVATNEAENEETGEGYDS